MEEELTVQELGITNRINLCDSCEKEQPECDGDNLIFGDGSGNDNIAACAKYGPLKLNSWVKK